MFTDGCGKDLKPKEWKQVCANDMISFQKRSLDDYTAAKSNRRLELDARIDFSKWSLTYSKPMPRAAPTIVHEGISVGIGCIIRVQEQK
jgi:hypothetical protein